MNSQDTYARIRPAKPHVRRCWGGETVNTAAPYSFAYAPIISNRARVVSQQQQQQQQQQHTVEDSARNLP